ncbi:MAG TPA: hypothetical protein VNI01_06875 [Elusimicrobiota bacterium]|jgi:hypothetical protein|nr:hypothetical protein [Elusimicrobiota bacterium]
MAATASPKVIRNARDVAAHLSALKRDKGGDAWWAEALTFDWSAPRPGGNASTWVSVNYTDESRVKARLYVRITGERHSKNIMPINSEDLVELQSRSRGGKGGKGTPEVRTMKPAVQFQKWAAKVTTDGDNSFTVIATPGDEHLSAYYQLAELVHEAFTSEVRVRLDKGETLTFEARTLKDAAALLAKVEAKARGDIFLNANQMQSLQRNLPSAALDKVKACAQVLTNTKVAPLVQTQILKGEQTGQFLPNPIARVTIDVEIKSDKLKCALHDKTKPYVQDGKPRYEPAKVNGEPVTNANIHKFLTPGSLVDGLVCMDSVCYSNMGISMPVKLEIAVVLPAPPKEATLDDVYGDEAAGPPAGKEAGAESGPELKRPAAETGGDPAPAGKDAVKETKYSQAKPPAAKPRPKEAESKRSSADARQAPKVPAAAPAADARAAAAKAPTASSPEMSEGDRRSLADSVSLDGLEDLEE